MNKEGGVGFGGGRAGAQVNDALKFRKFACRQMHKELVGFHIIGKLASPEIFPLFRRLQAIDHQKIIQPFLIQLRKKHAPDKSGAAGDRPHNGHVLRIFSENRRTARH